MVQSILYSLVIFYLNINAMFNVTERNQLKYEADKAINQKKYKEAAVLYQRLSEATFLVSTELRLDLANAYFMTNDTAKAIIEYRKLEKISNIEQASTAKVQIGLLVLQKKDSLRALTYFKEALEKNADNEVARFNYEWLRKSLPSSKSLPQRIQQQQNEQQLEQKKDEKLEQKKNNLDEEQSLQVLNAMRASDVEHISKQRRITNKKTKNDW